MRSRYSAFARGLGPYLVKTLAAGHEDRALPEETLARSLSSVREKQRFMSLRILDAFEEPDRAEVLFFACIFEKGKDRSFVELSTFAREDGAWRYESGTLVPLGDLPADLSALTRESFLKIATKRMA
jgi:SEC-C motif-containing protein